MSNELNIFNLFFFLDKHPRTVTAQHRSAERPQEARGPVASKAVEQLRSLGKDLQAIRLQVEEQLGGTQSSAEWIQVGFIIDRLLFALYILFISVSFITIIIIWANSYNQ